MIEEKRWSPELEEKIRNKWKEEGWFRFKEKEGKKFFVIDTPPPYPGPVWHIGAAVSYVLQDFIARSRRLMGYNVIFPMGFDRNGLPIEFYVEKYENVRMFSYPREKFLELCKKHLDKYVDGMKEALYLLNVSAELEKYYQTDSEEYRALTQKTFAKLWKKGLIYEEERPNNYCPKCKTTVADAEVEYKEMKGILAKIRFPLEEGGFVEIETSRPELLGACQALAFNPSDERYKHLEGKNAIIPLYNRKVKIYSHKEVNPSFGTGIEMVCSFGDVRDVKMFRDLKLKPIKLINEERKLTENAGKYKGLKVEEARKKMIKDLEKEGFLVDLKEYVHKVPVHERCETPIEIIPMKEYYLKQMDFLKEIEKIGKEIKFIPERYKQHLFNWIKSVNQDWPISRRRYYGTEIPIWKCKNCNYIYVPEDGKYHQPWKEKPNIVCPNCGKKDWEGEKRILDTWFDSSITLLYITKYEKDEEFFKKAFEGIKLRPQGYDIIRTWLYYTLLRVYLLEGKRAFDFVIINGMGLDKHGRKMSKRYGNVILPKELAEKYGGDAIRLWFAMETSIGENYRVNEEKIKSAFKFLTKYLNICRFVSNFERPKEVTKLQESDKWILEEVKKLKNEVLELYEKFDFHNASLKLYSFIWDVFASHYIELVKKRAKMDDFSEEEANSARYTLWKVVEEINLLLHPLIPAITTFVAEKMLGKDYEQEEYKKVGEINKGLIEAGRRLMEFNSKVWKAKKEKGIKLKESIEVEIPKELKAFEKDLIKMHNIIKR